MTKENELTLDMIDNVLNDMKEYNKKDLNVDDLFGNLTESERVCLTDKIHLAFLRTLLEKNNIKIVETEFISCNRRV